MAGRSKAENVKIYALVCLTVVMVAMAWLRFGLKPARAAPARGTAAAGMLEEAAKIPEWAAGGETEPLSLAPQPYTAPRRDLFAPVTGIVPSATNASGTVAVAEICRPRLSAVMKTCGQSQAILDGRAVRVGGRAGDYVVASISAREVVVTSATVRLVLTLGD